MLKELEKLTGLTSGTSEWYRLMKYPHPAANKPPTLIDGPPLTLEQAQEFCSRDSSSFKEGPEKDWYFIGYVRTDDRTKFITLW